MTETATSFTLNETGVLTSASTETGNSVEGEYTSVSAGADSYTLIETGVNTVGQVTGADRDPEVPIESAANC
jgi:hypothetical protein